MNIREFSSRIKTAFPDMYVQVGTGFDIQTNKEIFNLQMSFRLDAAVELTGNDDEDQKLADNIIDQVRNKIDDMTFVKEMEIPEGN